LRIFHRNLHATALPITFTVSDGSIGIWRFGRDYRRLLCNAMAQTQSSRAAQALFKS